MLRIGDFSSLSQVTIKTLRHYDEQGLLPPAHVDAATGYRYYAVTQLPRLHRILALRDLGFSLDQIRSILDDGVSVEQLRGMLLLRQAEQQERVEEEQSRLTRLRNRLSLIDKENSMNDVILKQIPAQWIASVRETIPNYPSVGKLCGEVMAGVPPGTSGIGVALWHDPEFRDHDVDAEGGIYLKEPVLASGRVQLRQLPSVTVASAMHRGAYRRLPEAYDALLRWVGNSGYVIAGPIRELYLQISMPVRQDDESYITEIQVPVSKAA